MENINESIARAQLQVILNQKDLVQDSLKREENEFGQKHLKTILDSLIEEEEKYYAIIERFQQKSIKKNRTFKLSDYSFECILQISEHEGVSQSQAIERLVDLYYLHNP